MSIFASSFPAPHVFAAASDLPGLLSGLGAAAAGLGFGLSLIVAIGAQNAFVLRQGLRREHVLAVVAICAVSDAALILLGISGIGTVAALAPWLITAVRWGGVAFLVVYGVLALRRAARPGRLGPAEGAAPAGAAAAVAACLAMTWLNPHVYLDTMVLTGSVGNGYGEQRWWFGGGAVLGSLVWFTALGYGARFLGPVFRSPRAWRVLDLVIACTMFAIAASLAMEA
ncbi:L-lysine exporter family protein LysE/ArgO [Nocardiopsis composta]|uniref:L-lysine exporter family protein LysE/ArgO n=1 Tax=Nocardiopsis composta TaxID=157465 RepID=A0A7W8QIQ0_9ACTN|nr:L-lysine exporter family protein LysE/ArgO [Nocardiopsis composta]